MGTVILSIDPGTEKCGIALLNLKGEVLNQLILPFNELEPFIKKITEMHSPMKVAIGNSTGCKRVIQIMNQMKINYEIIEERYSSLEARQLYFKMHPPRGLKKLLPKGFWVPSVAIDDWSAVIIGQRYLAHFNLDGDNHDITK